MIEIDIKPLEGVVINGSEIRLGASQSDVRTVMGEPYSTGKNSLYFCDNEVRFDFDNNGRVEFIEFLGGIDGDLQPTVYGVLAFQTDSDELYDLLKQRNNGEIDDSEAEYSYGFLEISVGIYREITPYDVQQMIADAKLENNPIRDDDIDEEMRRASHWGTIGIGVPGYYKQ